MALNELKSLFIYTSDKQDEGCHPFLFFLQSVDLSSLDSAFIARGSILNTNTW